MQDHRSIRENLLLVSACLFSLACAAYFLSTFKTVQASPGHHASPAAAVVKNVSARSRSGRPNVSDVVDRALAFRAMLDSTQQATLEQPYTTALAGRWSNLPCAATCRNGVQLGSLTAAQLAAALAVIETAAGTVDNEGSDEFDQIRLADTVLATAQSSGSGGGPGGGSGGGPIGGPGGGPGDGSGGGPGGFSYGEGFYYLAFLNTPSKTGAWMLQYGGHHYAANIAFNRGHVVGTTPLFEALEPLSFTAADGTTYAPLAEEHDALASMLASLNETELAAAKLSTTFGDVTMSPGESNGGNGTFPTTKVGLAVGTLNRAQKRLVLEAMKPWVQDMDDTVAANLLAIYRKELDDTYIAFTGDGVAGDASSFLISNTNYARIDGPSVWIEFACQNGVVFPTQIHYHTVWRDHVRDYGKDLTLTAPLDKSGPCRRHGHRDCNDDRRDRHEYFEK
ncbi:MAG TPA: DUF3500 domain-containing protein [Blastocatellia bacterium]|nr:DUF3500 domain-containing protein [Blastocatellia bacterium]